jgi:hypothetical protein
MCIFYPCTKISRTQKFAKQALFTTVKEIIHDINSPLIISHTDVEYITTFLRHTCVSSSHMRFIVMIFAHILQLHRQLCAPKTLHETPLIKKFLPQFSLLGYSVRHCVGTPSWIQDFQVAQKLNPFPSSNVSDWGLGVNVFCKRVARLRKIYYMQIQ